MKKKVLSIILALTMIMAVPLYAFASSGNITGLGSTENNNGNCGYYEVCNGSGVYLVNNS